MDVKDLGRKILGWVRKWELEARFASQVSWQDPLAEPGPRAKRKLRSYTVWNMTDYMANRRLEVSSEHRHVNSRTSLGESEYHGR
jgi:hypothetical protein